MPLPAAAQVTQSTALPESLPIAHLRVTLRLLEAAALPAFKGGLLRGGFGYAFQRIACTRACHGASEQCPVPAMCPYRWVFATPRPPDVPHLHNLRDVPRPFVIEPPDDRRTSYQAGETLEFGLMLIGRGIDYLPYFLFSFEQLGRMGLGRQHARARLERVEALRPWQPTGLVIYQDGQLLPAAPTEHRLPAAEASYPVPVYTSADIVAHAAALPTSLRLMLHTPLRVKARGAFIEQIDPAALVQAICWRLAALAAFHEHTPWTQDYRPYVEQARAISVTDADVRWVDWTRTSTRGERPHKMKLGGLIGNAVLREVPPDICALLLAGSLVHIGKACTFGHGRVEVTGWQGEGVTR